MKQFCMLFWVTLIVTIQGVEVGAQTKTIKKRNTEATKRSSDSEDAPNKKKKTLKAFKSLMKQMITVLLAATK